MRPAFAAPAEQLVVVTSPGWSATSATLRRFERPRPGAPWHAVGAAVPVVLGRAGLGWGAGLHPAAWAAADEPRKAEGDGRSPAGLFALEELLTLGAPPPAAHLPARRIGPLLRCVDDAAHPAYGTLVEAPAPPAVAPWRSAEVMAIPVYEEVITVAHNPRHTPGAGSCIFVHLTDGKPTAGCTALPRSALHGLALWLRPSARLLALPTAVYARLAATNGWPALAADDGADGGVSGAAAAPGSGR